MAAFLISFWEQHSIAAPKMKSNHKHFCHAAESNTGAEAAMEEFGIINIWMRLTINHVRVWRGLDPKANRRQVVRSQKGFIQGGGS